MADIQRKQQKHLLRTRLYNLLPAAPFVLPGLILACVFVIYPLLFNIRISFSNYQIVKRTMTFVGFDNYTALFTEPQSRLFVAIRNNFLYAIITTPFILFFGLLFAVLINNLRRARMVFRTFFYLPVITSWVIVGMVFAYMFNAGERGLVNYLLVDVFHLTGDYIPWLQKTWTGNTVIWIMGIWKNIGWSMIIYLAGLQGISSELYEAAGIEASEVAMRLGMPNLASGVLDQANGGWLAHGRYDRAQRADDLRAAIMPQVTDILEIGDFYAMGAWGRYCLGRRLPRTPPPPRSRPVPRPAAMSSHSSGTRFLHPRQPQRPSATRPAVAHRPPRPRHASSTYDDCNRRHATWPAASTGPIPGGRASGPAAPRTSTPPTV
jgi:ABC-type sugar transport system permease subunit